MCFGSVGGSKDRPLQEAVASRRIDRNTGYARNVIRIGELEGDCFAKANISAAETAAGQDARISGTHEDRRRPQGAGGAT